jgi:DNA mismatch repair protein MSH5
MRKQSCSPLLVLLDGLSLTVEPANMSSLRPGRSTLSYGTQCAAMSGIPAPIISRAASLANLTCQGEDLVAVCAVMSPEEEEDLEDAEMTARAFLEQEFDELTSSEDPRSVLESVLGESTTGSVIVS